MMDDIYKQMHDQTQQLHICTKEYIKVIERFHSRLSSEVSAILAATHPVLREEVNELLSELLYNIYILYDERLYEESKALMEQIYQLHEHRFREKYRLLQSEKHQITQISKAVDDYRFVYNMFFNQYQNCTQQVHTGKTLWEEITPIVEYSRNVLWEIERRYYALEIHINKFCDGMEKKYMDTVF